MIHVDWLNYSTIIDFYACNYSHANFKNKRSLQSKWECIYWRRLVFDTDAIYFRNRFITIYSAMYFMCHCIVHIQIEIIISLFSNDLKIIQTLAESHWSITLYKVICWGRHTCILKYECHLATFELTALHIKHYHHCPFQFLVKSVNVIIQAPVWSHRLIRSKYVNI